MKEQGPNRLTNQSIEHTLFNRGQSMAEAGSPEIDKTEAEPALRPRPERAAAADVTGEEIAESFWGKIVNSIHAIDNREARKEAVRGFLGEISPQATIPTQFLKLVAEHDETLDYLVNRIVAQPLDAETSHYSISMYAGINLEQIKEILKTDAEKTPAKKERYHRVLGVIEATHLFHEMNREIVTGNLEGFVGAARAITPEQLQTLQEVPGVSQVMRLFDDEYQRLLARDDYIKNQGNYDDMMGIRRDKDGEVTHIEGRSSIEDRLKLLVSNANKGIDVGKELKGLEPWQIAWAFNAGKIMTNLSLRAAEMISLGQLPGEGNDERYGSFPQESAAKLMNWLSLSGLRFDISKIRGGVQLAEMTIENYQKDRKKQGYGETNLTKIGGKEIKDFELPSMSGVSGIWSTWRENTILLKPIPLLNRIREFKAKNPADLEAIFFKDGVLKEEINSYLGVLLKLGSITPSETDTKEMLAAKWKIRTEIWKRAAQDNPLAVANFLTGLEFKGKVPEGYFDIKTILKETGGVWDSLRTKLIIAHEARMSAIRRGETEVSLDKFIASNASKNDTLKLDPAETNLLAKIRKNGELAAGEFANIRLPFTPFLNDVIFEKAQYGEAGAEFFRRRIGSDLPSFNNSYNEFVKLMDNPGAMSFEDALKVLHGMVQALGSPQSTTTGQDKVAPFFEAYLDFITAGEHIKGRFEGLKKAWAKNNMVAGIKKLLNKPNSMAQEFSGEGALALNKFGLRKGLDKALHDGVLRRGKKDKNGKFTTTDLYDEFLKKKGVKFLGLLLAFLIEMFPVFFLGSGIEFGKQTGK